MVVCIYVCEKKSTKRRAEERDLNFHWEPSTRVRECGPDLGATPVQSISAAPLGKGCSYGSSKGEY